MLTGHLPFDGDDEDQVFNAIRVKAAKYPRSLKPEAVSCLRAVRDIYISEKILIKIYTFLKIKLLLRNIYISERKYWLEIYTFLNKYIVNIIMKRKENLQIGLLVTEFYSD